MRAYQAACVEVTRRFEGHIAQYLGDGLLVYFGYPVAHEDDAQRAVHTGLSILEAMPQLNTRLERERRVRLAVRLGIHTGLVVVGEMGGGDRQEQLALGETPNIATRLQDLTAPNTVVISAATHQLVHGLFTCQALGAHTLKGVVQPLEVYRILSTSEAQSRFEVAVSTGLTPLVGRESEVSLLLERWAHSQDGRGQVVLLRGEPGIGKSRLVEVLRERVISEGATRIVFRCSPYYQNSALYPLIDHLQRFLQWHRDGVPEAKLDKLEQVLRTSRLPLEEVVPPSPGAVGMAPTPETRSRGVKRCLLCTRGPILRAAGSVSGQRIAPRPACSSAQRRDGRERPREGLSPGADGVQSALRHRADHDTARSGGSVVRTKLATHFPREAR